MKQTQNRRSGLTLTELLIVIAIIVIVTAVLAPLLTSSMEGREVREAARQVNMFFQQARTKAKQLNRPVGVVIRRSPNNPDLAYQLTLAEEVPPFTGFSAFSKARVVYQGLQNGDEPYEKLHLYKAYVENSGTGVKAAAEELIAAGIQPNDRIRFNYRTQQYRILSIETDGSIVFEVDGVNTNRHTISQFGLVPFEVFRRPRQSVGKPLELPTGAVLVMDLSGVGTVGKLLEQTNKRTIGIAEFKSQEGVVPMPPLTIMFNPGGEVDRVYRFLPPVNQHMPGYVNFPPKRPQDKVYLFVGKDGIDPLTNIKDGTNIWIAIDQQTGAVNTAPNAVPPEFAASTNNLMDLITESRQIAATGQSMGGL